MSGVLNYSQNRVPGFGNGEVARRRGSGIPSLIEQLGISKLEK
ncbi:hypothetical protein LEP1GSC170_1595 [Leptospira interrogans serovar Bataviae str. HAI135]|nr:hypothetical protein LEP1GSC170_1595 [Leptospira interrogans serovar Bataviae str. HAI135]